MKYKEEDDKKLGNPFDNTIVKLRFYSFIDIPENENDCWMWKGYKDKDGYGKFTYDKRQRSAHRIMYELENEKIPPGMMVLHEPINCNNPSCVNPKHLRLGMHKDNEDDKIKRGTYCSIRNPMYKVKLENHPRYVNVPDNIACEIIKRIRVDKEPQSRVIRDYDFSMAVVRRLLAQFDGEYKQIEVYIAGGFFNEEQLKAVSDIEERLKKESISFFSPRLEGGILKNMSPREKARSISNVYRSNIDAIEEAGVVLAIIDDFDTGTVFEMGYAVAKGVPVISISNKNYGLNVMLSESVQAHVTNHDDMIKAIINSEYTGEIIRGVY